MSDELKKALSEYVLKLLSSFEKGANWTAEQIPLVIQEKLRYDLAAECIWLVFMGSVLGLCIWVISKGVRNLLADEDPEWYMPNFVCGGLFGLLSLSLCIAGILAVLKILIAPRLYIVEWLKNSL